MIDITSTALTGSVIPFGGSALCGFFAGWALRKVLKWIMIIAGVIFGVIILAMAWLQQNGYINGKIEWDKLGNDAASYGQHIMAQVDPTNLHGVFQTLGIPVGSGMGLGLLAGFMKGR